MKKWPDRFDFETDPICQTVFKPFIEQELARLQAYDARRPADITYIFHEHARRVAEDIRKTCLFMGLGHMIAHNMYWAMLPHDIGKRKLPVEIWDQEEKPDENLKHERRRHTELGPVIVKEELKDLHHPFRSLMEDIMLNHHEQMDGKGYRGLKAGEISPPVRLAAIVEAFDGWRIPRPHFGTRDISVSGVLKRMREEKAHMFDKMLFDAFSDMKMQENIETD